MSEGPDSTFPQAPGDAPPPPARPSVEAWPAARDVERVAPIEIVAPDKYCAALLLDYAAPLFPAEIVSGPAWIVRLHPPPTGGAWVSELLALVERWLESAPLPCAKVLHCGQNYLVRASTGAAGVAVATAASTPAVAPTR